MANRIQIRRDSESNWNNINPILADGELALTYDNNQIKIGDGSTNWSGLSYATGAPNLATVATSGSYTDLTNKPNVPESVGDLISSSIGYSVSNNRQFLRWKAENSSIEFSSDFRVVPFSSVAYPNGTLGQDKVGDVAFSADAIYYCVQEPNSYSLTWVDPSGWAGGIIQLSNRGPNNEVLAMGSTLTDGNQVVTVTELITGGWDGTRQVVRLSSEISAWRSGTGTLTVLTSGTTANTHIWAKIGSEVVSAPSTLTSPGIVGQIAYDSNYIYRCTQTNVSEISSVYSTPHSYNGGGNQNAGSSMMNVLDAGGVPAPQVGWIISDGSSQRTITNVVRQNSAWNYIYTLTFSGGDINWNTLNSITIISRPAVSGQWVKAKWFSGSYNDLTNKPTIPTDVNQLSDADSLLGPSNPFDQTLNTTDTPEFNEVNLSQDGVLRFPTTEGLAWDSVIKQESREIGARFGLVIDGERDVTVKTDQGGFQWLFENDGILHLPASVGDIKRDGVSVLGGGGSSSPAGAGSVGYSNVWVISSKADSFWTSYSLSGNIEGLFGSSDLTNVSQTAYGKQVNTGDKILIVNDSLIHTNSEYGIVIEFPSSPSVGDTFTTPAVNPLTTYNAGSFVVGKTYTIVSVGNTNFIALGASSNTVGQSFVANGVGSGTGTASTSTGVSKLIFKPASGQKIIPMQNGGGSPVNPFGQGTSSIAGYLDLSSYMGGQPITWVYAGVFSTVPTWYQLYF